MKRLNSNTTRWNLLCSLWYDDDEVDKNDVSFRWRGNKIWLWRKKAKKNAFLIWIRKSALFAGRILRNARPRPSLFQKIAHFQYVQSLSYHRSERLSRRMTEAFFQPFLTALPFKWKNKTRRERLRWNDETVCMIFLDLALFQIFLFCHFFSSR